jgi:hypothetical protein
MISGNSLGDHPAIHPMSKLPATTR